MWPLSADDSLSGVEAPGLVCCSLVMQKLVCCKRNWSDAKGTDLLQVWLAIALLSYSTCKVLPTWKGCKLKNKKWFSEDFLKLLLKKFVKNF